MSPSTDKSTDHQRGKLPSVNPGKENFVNLLFMS